MKRYFRLVQAGAFAWMVVLSAVLAEPAFAGRVALVLGNSAYEHTVPLANPQNDAEAVSSALRDLGFDVYDGYDLGRSDATDLIRAFARAATDADTALLYYAGHGLEVGGINYLVPVDAQIRDEADLQFETINLNDIVALMERDERTNLIFLDACRDNPMAGNLARNMGTRSSAIGRGLARLDTGLGTLIAYATQPGNVALDGTGRHSPFTDALLQHIATPDLDVELMMRRVRRDVIDLTGGQQVPWSSSSLTGSFMFQTQPQTPEPVMVPLEEGAPAPAIETEIAPAESIAAPDATPVAPPETVAVPDATPAPTVTASLEPTEEPAADAEDVPATPLVRAETMSDEQLALRVQMSLNRLGCEAGTEDGIWGRNSRNALERLAEHADALTLASLEPTAPLLRAIEVLEGRICPLVCGPTENLVDDACIRKTCPSGQNLSSQGVCFTPQPTARRTTSPQRSGSSCFSFNGQTFCQ